MSGIVLLLIYSFASEFTIAAGDSTSKISNSSKMGGNNAASVTPKAIEADTDSGSLSVGPVSKHSSHANEEELRALFMGENTELYTASRGETSRTDASSQTDQEESQKSAAVVATEKPSEAAVKPEAAVTVKTEAAAEEKHIAQAEEKPAAPAEEKSETRTVEKQAAQAQAETAEQPAAAPEAASAQADSGYEYELDLLARLITAEAQAEPYEAQVAVGAVVINRVQSGSWPNSIKEVIYQNINGYYQFTPVVNGWIDKPAESEAVKAAKAALSGADPTSGAEFYYDDTTTNEWILAKKVSIQIGHMIFAF